MKKSIILLAAVLLFAAFSGCGGSDPEAEIVGKWTLKFTESSDGTRTDVNAGPSDFSFEFFSDHTVERTIFGVSEKGEWKLADSKITVTYPSAPGKEPEIIEVGKKELSTKLTDGKMIFVKE